MLHYFKGLIISLMTLLAIACHSPVLHRKAKDLAEKPSSVANDKTGKVSSVANTHKSDSVSNASVIADVLVAPAVIVDVPVIIDVAAAIDVPVIVDVDAAAVILDVPAPVKIIRPIKARISQSTLDKNLKELETKDATAEIMQGISQLLQTETGHRSFDNPIPGGYYTSDNTIWGNRAWGRDNSIYEVQLLSKTEVGKQEIAANENLKAYNTEGFEIYSYNYQNYKSKTAEYGRPIVSGEYYAIKDKSNRTMELLGFLRIETKKGSQEYIHLTFGEQESVDSIYTNTVVIDENNDPLRGKLSVEYFKTSANSRMKTYDFENLTKEDKVALKELKIFSDID